MDVLLAAAEEARSHILSAYPRLHVRPVAAPAVEGVGAAPPRVAMCVHCKNRLWQLKLTLPINLLHLWPCRAWTTFVLVDFGSTDGSVEWVLGHCRPAIDCGFLRVFRARPMQPYHTARTKNTAHITAVRDIGLDPHDVLVNCDADNLLGAGFAQHVAQQFSCSCPRGRQGLVIQYYGGARADGTFGRLAYRVKNFVLQRGCDEDSLPAGNHDSDLLARLQGSCRCRRLPAAGAFGYRFCQAIPNTKVDTVGKDAAMPWKAMDRNNRRVFQARRANKTRRNPGGFGVSVWRVSPSTPRPRRLRQTKKTTRRLAKLKAYNKARQRRCMIV